MQRHLHGVIAMSNATKQSRVARSALDCFASLAMTMLKHTRSLSRRIRVRVLHQLAALISRGRREGRKLAAPMAPVRMKSTGQEPQVRPRHPDLPCANGLRLIRALLGDRRSCPRHPRCPSKAPRAWPQHREARTTRLHRPRMRRSSTGAPTSIAARLHVRDDAYAPFDEAGCG